ncbi:MAG: hypothetical protein QOI57_2950 [Rubrobacteraceae bacterium]|nr:hypothetical protein [Rubrobacteraceae bacterium]
MFSEKLTRPSHKWLLLTLTVGLGVAAAATAGLVLVSCPASAATTVSFAPAPGSPFPAGSFPFGITSADFNGHGKPDLAVTNANSNNVTVLLNTTPLPPVANDDSYSTTQDQPLNVPAPGVLSNDTNPNTLANLTAVKVTDPNNGTLTLNPDGSFTYTPNPGFSGSDSFTYKGHPRRS